MTTRSCPKCSMLMARCDFKYCPDCGAQLDRSCPSDVTDCSPSSAHDPAYMADLITTLRCELEEARDDANKARAYKRVLKLENGELRRKRDKAIGTLKSLASQSGHKSAPGCNCMDCQYIRPLEDAIRHASSENG